MSGFWKKILGSRGHPNLRPQESISFERDASDWKAVFDDASILINGPKQIEETQARLMSHLSRVYQVFERQNQQQVTFLQSVIGAVDYCEGLDPRTKEINAVRQLLLSALFDQGVAPWAPTIGERNPEGCEPVAVEISADHPALTVLKVLTSGYIWKSNTILRRPRVVISKTLTTIIPPSGIIQQVQTEGGAMSEEDEQEPA
jgi:hypothetical protein